jgi:hypothetical protein
MTAPQKITFGEMRQMGVRGLLVYCSDYHCSHWAAISGDQWPDNVRLSDHRAALHLPSLRHEGRQRQAGFCMG